MPTLYLHSWYICRRVWFVFHHLFCSFCCFSAIFFSVAQQQNFTNTRKPHSLIVLSLCFVLVRSYRRMMFLELRRHLYETWRDRKPKFRSSKRIYDDITDTDDVIDRKVRRIGIGYSREDVNILHSPTARSEGLAEVIDMEIEEMMTDVAGRLRNKMLVSQHLHRISTLTERTFLRLYPNYADLHAQ